MSSGDEELIEAMSYGRMLRIWRFEKKGSPFTSGEIGKYFKEVMDRKRAELSPEELTAISKKVGW